MSHNKLIKLNIYNFTMWVVILRVLMLLAALSALINFQLGLAVVLLALALSFDRIPFILNLFKVNKSELTLIIFVNGTVRLESDGQDTIGGFLGAQQWCNSQMAVLQIIVGEETRHMLVLSAQQTETDNYRRLKMWLRQDFCRDAKDMQVTGD